MLKLSVLRWGKPYESLETDEVKHFITGETLAKVGQANGALVAKDAKLAKKARQVLRDIPMKDLIEKIKKAADLYLSATLPLGDGTQTPDEFARMQSASTGLPEHMNCLTILPSATLISRTWPSKPAAAS